MDYVSHNGRVHARANSFTFQKLSDLSGTADSIFTSRVSFFVFFRNLKMGYCFVDFERPDNYILKLEPRMSKFYNIYKHNLICLNWQNVNVDRFPQCCNISRVAILKFFGVFWLILLRKPLHFSLFNP